MFDFRHLGVLVLLLLTLQAKTDDGVNYGPANAFRFSVVAGKKTYAEGAKITLLMRFGNNASKNVAIQFDHTRTEAVVTRNRIILENPRGAQDFDLRAAARDTTIRLGEAVEWPVFVRSVSNLEAGAYKVTFRLFLTSSKNGNDPRLGLLSHVLEASTEFDVVLASQRPDSTAIPLEDLQVRLADSRSVEDRRSKPLVIRIAVANSGREPWFYHEQFTQRGLGFEVIDSKGRMLGRNKKGEALADSSPERFIRYSGPGPRSIEFLPGLTEDLGSFNLDAYTLLAPDSSYTVRVSWKGKGYRSSKDRALGKNAIPFEIRSDAISVRTPRD